MADSQIAPLTDEERAELEELRAEKARREEEERARRDRAELEALRAERAAAAAEVEADAQAEVKTAAAQPVRPSVASATVRPTASPSESSAPREKTFGQRMVTSASTDDDGIPSMPPAQKIIIAVCLLLVVAFALWSIFK